MPVKRLSTCCRVGLAGQERFYLQEKLFSSGELEECPGSACPQSDRCRTVVFSSMEIFVTRTSPENSSPDVVAVQGLDELPHFDWADCSNGAFSIPAPFKRRDRPGRGEGRHLMEVQLFNPRAEGNLGIFKSTKPLKSSFQSVFASFLLI